MNLKSCLHLCALWSRHNCHCLQPCLLWLLHVHRCEGGEISIFKSFFWVLSDWFPSDINLCSWTSQPSLEWSGGGDSTQSSQCLKSKDEQASWDRGKRPKEHPNTEDTCWHSPSLQHGFSPKKKHSKSPVCTLEMPGCEVSNFKSFESL